MAMLRKIQRVGKRATKFQYTATYQSVVIECLRDKWQPAVVCVAWSRKGRRLISKVRPWQPSPDNKMRGVVIWPDAEGMEITVTLYKGPKDKSYETKEWEFAVIDVDSTGKRKVLATTSINMVRYASTMPFDTDLTLRLKPVSRKIKSVILQISISSMFLKEGKATDDDMISIASMMSVSNLSTIGLLEDDEDESYYWTGGRSITPPLVPDHIFSTDQLLNWASDVTKDVSSVKITNMTTSWRNGIAFLAIIWYYRPDLVPDFDMLSPTSIKENSRLAFELARSLGVACPLTPNMMVTTTVPDKLAVTSFVYQLHQYFTRATQSAVTRAETKTDSGSVESPFHISQIPEMFSGKLSPVTLSPPSTDRVLNIYSRHSHDNSQVDLKQPSNRNVSADKSNLGEVNTQLTSVLSGDENGHARPVSPGTRAKLQLDLLVHEHPPVKTAEPQVEDANIVEGGHRPNSSEDRSFEFEHPEDTSSSEQFTTETSSYQTEDNEEEIILPELPLDPKPLSKEPGAAVDLSPGRKSSGRKLPSPPTDAESKEQIAKRERRRKQAQEMLRQHNIKLSKSSEHLKILGDTTTGSNKSKYRKQAIEMLTEAFNTPKSSRRATISTPEEHSLPSESGKAISNDGDGDSSLANNETVHLKSSVDLTTSSSMEALHDTPETETSKPITQNSNHGDNPISAENQSTSAENQSTSAENQSTSAENQSTSAENQSTSVNQGARKDKSMLSQKRMSSDTVLLETHKTHIAKASSSTSHLPSAPKDDKPPQETKKINQTLKHSRLGTISTNNRPRSASVGGVGQDESTQKRPCSANPNKSKKGQLPAIKPISTEPSQSFLRLVEQKRKQELAAAKVEADANLLRLVEQKTKQELAAAKAEADAKLAAEAHAERERQDEIDSASKQTKEEENDVDENMEDTQLTRDSRVTPTHKNSLPSPAWSQHSADLCQDLLQTQSEYVKTELLKMQEQLEKLESRAVETEQRVRETMSEGNKQAEEDRMQEWFGILNRKNELIKRQIELNMIEKEEDLEKRQFFLNRELRPLMEIPEDEKTSQQKEREGHLLKNLLELIDERDKLERRKMTTERNTDHERFGFASAQASASDIVNTSDTLERKIKDCVIS